MSEGVPEGASLPEGIAVDDTAAYFGVIESSDVLQQLMDLDSKQALSKTLEHLSDVVLQPGEFNFEAASERLQCEGGEIYFLIFGHLNLMSLPDPMLAFAGQPDSTGSTSSAHPLATEEVINSISVLFDPMQFLKILAIGYSTGGEPEVGRYLTSIQEMMENPSQNLEKIQALAAESVSSLDVAGHALPIALLASEGAEPATIEARQSMPAQEKKPEPVSKPAEPAPVKEVTVEQPVSVPLPTTESVPLPTIAEENPSTSVPLPSFETSVVEEESPKNDVEADLATQDAFSGAFGTELIPEVEEIIQQPVIEEVPVEEPVVEEPRADETIEEPAEEWVSDAERFIAADVDESGALSVEELAVAANLPLDTAEELHKAADTDGDGEVTLSEFVSSDAAKTMSSLPRPVAPVRRPIQKQQPQQQSAPSPGIQAPQAGWQQQPVQPVQQQPVQQQPVQPVQQQPIQQQPVQQQPMQQQPGMNIQPTILSGIHCRGCGIGLDPYWRFCPICGNMNTSAHR